MNGGCRGYVSPSIVTWISCIASSRADCVFGEARLISSTRRMFANTGPERNSNALSRWLKTLTPVTSDGSRSGVNWRREKSRSSERASAFASIVLPTPGKSSMIRCPSATRQMVHIRNVSFGACTTRARFAATRSITSVEESTALSGLASMSLLEQPLDLVEHSRCDHRFRRPRHVAFPLPRHQHDLVVGCIEPDPLLGHIVVDDEIEVLAVQHRALPLPAGRPYLGTEADEHLPVALLLAEDLQDVDRRLEREIPRLSLHALAVERRVRPVVGDGGRHQDDVCPGRPLARLALEISCGRSLDDLDADRCADGEIRRQERHVRPTQLRLGGQRDAHAARRAVAEVAHRV